MDNLTNETIQKILDQLPNQNRQMLHERLFFLALQQIGGIRHELNPSAGNPSGATAVVYIRQSSVYQVEHNLESQKRQYQLVDRAHALGWSPDHCLTIDDDLGLSGAQSYNRPGYQRLISMLALREVGFVLDWKYPASRAIVLTGTNFWNWPRHSMYSLPTKMGYIILGSSTIVCS